MELGSEMAVSHSSYFFGEKNALVSVGWARTGEYSGSFQHDLCRIPFNLLPFCFQHTAIAHHDGRRHASGSQRSRSNVIDYPRCVPEGARTAAQRARAG